MPNSPVRTEKKTHDLVQENDKKERGKKEENMIRIMKQGGRNHGWVGKRRGSIEFIENGSSTSRESGVTDVQGRVGQKIETAKPPGKHCGENV